MRSATGSKVAHAASSPDEGAARYGAGAGETKQKEDPMSIQDRISEEIERLKGLRDELDVQAHLAKADAEDELREIWERAELTRAKLDAEYQRLREGVGENLEGVGEAAELLVDEVKKSYKRIRELL
jgi:hypothetical protein